MFPDNSIEKVLAIEPIDEFCRRHGRAELSNVDECPVSQLPMPLPPDRWFRRRSSSDKLGGRDGRSRPPSKRLAARRPIESEATMTSAQSHPAGSTANPLLESWQTPFEAPPFSAIAPAHFQPAFDVALDRHTAEIAAIAGNPAPATFETVIAALEGSGRMLDRVSSVFWNLTGAHTSAALQQIERDIAPRLAAHWNAITSNAALFQRIDSVHAARDTLQLTAEQRRILERTHLNFVRAGARLGAEAKARKAEIVERLATLHTAFSQNVLADEKAFVLPLSGKAELAGLPDFVREAARSAAKERGLEGHVVTLSRSLIEPFLTFSARRDLREAAFKAWVRRGENGGATDNRANVAEQVALNLEFARLMGHRTYAAYSLEDTMAKAPAAVFELLETTWQPAKARAAEERARLSAMAAAEGQNIAIEPWDWRHYAEKVRRAELALDEAEIKSYLPLERIVEAAFFTANRLFGLSFSERRDVETYHPDVRVFEVRDAAGGHVGLFLGDYFARPSKRSGAWMSSFRSQDRLDGNHRPIIVNVMNFAKAAEGRPTLLSLDDARTLFHEFGHGLHGLMSDVTYPSLAGTAVSRDFVELPSQLFEHWLLTPDVLSRFARHHESGAAMPEALIEKIRAARTFNQGFHTVEYVASALVDMAFHSLDAATDLDPIAFERATLDRLGMPQGMAMRHRTPHFSHIFTGGYTAGYYSYLWSEVLDADAFAAFEETGDVFDAATGSKLKHYIYSAGNLRDPVDAYKNFRGRLPTIDGLLKKRGLDRAA
jgi:peptidyl-dipeptidase Dcp